MTLSDEMLKPALGAVIAYHADELPDATINVLAGVAATLFIRALSNEEKAEIKRGRRFVIIGGGNDTTH